MTTIRYDKNILTILKLYLKIILLRMYRNTEDNNQQNPESKTPISGANDSVFAEQNDLPSK